MQATVASYDAQTHTGSVVADDGVRIPFAAEALTGARLRLLRPGQRVRIDVDGDGGITHLQIVTLSG